MLHYENGSYHIQCECCRTISEHYATISATIDGTDSLGWKRPWFRHEEYLNLCPTCAKEQQGMLPDAIHSDFAKLQQGNIALANKMWRSVALEAAMTCLSKSINAHNLPSTIPGACSDDPTWYFDLCAAHATAAGLRFAHYWFGTGPAAKNRTVQQ